MLTKRGIEANPEKCQVVIDMKIHANVKEVQQNKGRLVALSRFLSCAGDKEFTFSVSLKNKERFEWTGECEQVFSKIKSCLMSSFITRLREGSSLHLILSVTNQAMILVLVQDIDKVERPMYSVWKVFKGAKTRYRKIDNLVMTVINVTRKLRPYFQNHKVLLKTNYHVRLVVTVIIKWFLWENSDEFGRIMSKSKVKVWRNEQKSNTGMR